tara:strand:+ start:4172 stop:4912 length:741 start_codon:yes stop_codon:yes gene_type:complete
MRIRAKVIILINVMVAAILTILAVLNYFKFQNLLSDYTSSRVSVLSEEVRSTLINAENLGIKISESAKLKEVLDKIYNTETGIAYIYILNSDGEVVFPEEENEATVRKNLIQNSLAKSRASDKWIIQNDGTTDFGEKLFKNITNQDFYVIFGYQSGIFTDYYAEIRNNLFFLTVSVIVLSTILLAIVNFFVFRSLQGAYNQIRSSAENVFSPSSPEKLNCEDELTKSFSFIKGTLADLKVHLGVKN